MIEQNFLDNILWECNSDFFDCKLEHDTEILSVQSEKHYISNTCLKLVLIRVSLVSQRVKNQSLMQETQVQPLIQEQRLGHVPQILSLALEPRNHSDWAPVPQLLKSMCPRAHAPQEEKPCSEKPTRHSQRGAPISCKQRKAHRALKA